jgi:hypothetical protein
MGSTGLAGSPVAAERVKSIGWAACLSRDGAVRFFDNLVLKKEKRGRRGLCGRHPGLRIRMTP